MRHVGVITFHDYDNYGAILQSYALQRLLSSLDTDVELIDYSSRFIHKPWSIESLRKRGILNSAYTILGHMFYVPRRKRCNEFRKLMKFSAPVSKESLPEIEGRYDMIIAGSDQIWDCHLTNNDMTYYLNFVKNNKKKYSYAASFGEHITPPRQYEEEIRRLLNEFEYLVVREKYAIDEIRDLLGDGSKQMKLRTAVDPTFLLNGHEWSELAITPKKEKYILVYQLGINPRLVHFVKVLKKNTGLPVVYVPFPLVGLIGCSINLTIGPKEWIGLIKNAEYVVSDSFHGIVFSLLLHRRFFTMVEGHHSNQRLKELLGELGLLNRVVDDETVWSDVISAEMDFEASDNVIERKRADSIELIKEMVNHAVH